MKLTFESEDLLRKAAADAAVSWRNCGISPLIVGFRGDLGVGKTTWVRAMLDGLGYDGRVPSPTFTLLEHYEIDPLTIVHVDLYRVADASELEFLGLRDWLALSAVWMLVEWPERGGALLGSVDVELAFRAFADDSRSLTVEANSKRGRELVDIWIGRDLK